MQGDFLSPHIQAEIKAFLRDPDRGRARSKSLFVEDGNEDAVPGAIRADALAEMDLGYLDHVRQEGAKDDGFAGNGAGSEHDDKVVDVVLSDMSAPWEQTSGLWKNSLSNPYYRMMNTSGNSFRDHAGSMVSQPVRQKSYLFPSLSFPGLANGLCLLGTSTGPLPLRPTVQLRDTEDRRTLCLQVLSGRRG